MICQGCNKDLSLLSGHKKVGHKTHCKEYKQFKIDVENSITEEWLISEYVEKETSLTDMCKILHIDRAHMILRKLKEFDIHIKTKKEKYNSKKRIQKIKDTSFKRYGHIVGVHGT